MKTHQPGRGVEGDEATAEAGAARPAPRRHFVTMLFADLTDSTQLSATMEAEHYAALLARLSHAYWTVVARHKGLVVRIQGDGMLAVFGHPEPSEDDARRATEAALELHAAVRALGLQQATPGGHAPLTLHSGIHAGVVLVGEGDVVKGRLELTGVAPNIAARLSAAAGPDEVLVSAETLGPDQGLFVVGRQRQLQLKGAPAPVQALSIVARASAVNRFEARAKRGLSPFVGRADVLDTLTAALGSMRATPAVRSLALVGTAGMGKTRLANTFLELCQSQGLTVLRGYCESYLGAEPLQPFQQMLRLLAPAEPGLSGEAAADLALTQVLSHAPGWAPVAGFLPQSLSLKLPGRTAADLLPPQAVRQGFLSLFSALAQQGPLVVFIDDWQWADDGSHQLLDALTDLPLPMLLLLAARAVPELSLPQAVTPMEVRPLNADEAERTVKRWLPHAHPFLVHEICSYAGGNPLFLEELCHRAANDAELQPVVRVHGGEAWLNGLIASRVARLPKAQVELVQSAAVIGHTMPAWLFERVTGCAPDDPLVQALEDEDLIFPGEQPGTLRFKHGITRDVVYDGVGLRERTRLHLATAHALAARATDVATTGAEACEALAYHFDAAGEPQQAAAYAEAAGDRAVYASALDRAKSQYRAALASLDKLGPSPSVVKRWAGIAQRLGLASVFDPSREELPVFERAIQLAQASGDPVAIARARYWLGYMHYALGEAPTALTHLAEASRQAQLAQDQRLEVQIDATRGQALASAGQYREALQLLDAAIDIKRRHRSGAGNAVGLTYSLTCKGYALGDRGDFDEARACFEEALNDTGCDQPEVIGSVRGWYGAVLIWQGRYEEANRLASEAWREGDRVRSLHLMAMGRAVAGYARWRMSGDPQALESLREAVDWLSRRGNALFASLNHGWLTHALMASGDEAGARHHAAQALRRARRSDLLGASLACRTLALRAAEQGQVGKAERWLKTAQHWANVRESRREQAENLWCAAQLALARGDHTRGRALLDEASQAFAKLGMPARSEALRTDCLQPA